MTFPNFFKLTFFIRFYLFCSKWIIPVELTFLNLVHIRYTYNKIWTICVGEGEMWTSKRSIHLFRIISFAENTDLVHIGHCFLICRRFFCGYDFFYLRRAYKAYQKRSKNHNNRALSRRKLLQIYKRTT